MHSLIFICQIHFWNFFCIAHNISFILISSNYLREGGELSFAIANQSSQASVIVLYSRFTNMWKIIKKNSITIVNFYFFLYICKKVLWHCGCCINKCPSKASFAKKCLVWHFFCSVKIKKFFVYCFEQTPHSACE